jgi:hypothetical protein
LAQRWRACTPPFSLIGTEKIIPPSKSEIPVNQGFSRDWWRYRRNQSMTKLRQFSADSEVVYALPDKGMGLAFRSIPFGHEEVLEDWLTQCAV